VKKKSVQNKLETAHARAGLMAPR